MKLWNIRPAVLPDIATLVTLRLKLEQESVHLSDEKMTGEYRHAIHDYYMSALSNGTLFSLVAEAAGEIIATSSIIFFQWPPAFNNLSGREAYIWNMYTMPEWRRQGIATALLQKIMEVIKQDEVQYSWLYATSIALPLYEQEGFVVKTRSTTELYFS